MLSEQILFHVADELELDCDFCKETLGYIIFHWNETKKEHTCPECKNSHDADDPFLCKDCLKIENSNGFCTCKFISQWNKYEKFDQAFETRCDGCKIFLGSFLFIHSSDDDNPICKTCKRDFFSAKTVSVMTYCSKCRIRKR